MRSTSLRLAILYTAAFAVAVVALGALTLLATRAALADQFETRIRAESAALVQEYAGEGLKGLIDAVRERDSTPGMLDYGLQEASGAPLAGRLAGPRAPLGWSSVTIRAAGRAKRVEPLRSPCRTGGD